MNVNKIYIYIVNVNSIWLEDRSLLVAGLM